MKPRGNTLKLTAVAALVVLTLTGFSTGRGHGGSGDGGGGGGCSSSGQNHDSSSGSGGGSSRDDDHDYDYDAGSSSSGGSGSGSGGSSSSSPRDATVELLSCASKKAPYATVEVTNPHTVDGVFTVTVVFENAAGAEVVSRSQDVDVPGNGTATVRVNVDDPKRAPRITGCDPDPLAPATR
ncbi:hypothetical protein [Streptomyces sp.]|uniref:hypothetical protein n=1 Tax=Streptomyces sp. TaxID=1931 RepID=UPI0028110124|nr:hypothetical protein [Streptomyces sp.]